MDVDLKRKTARVTREPIDEPVRGAAFENEEVEVGLGSDEAVVEKQAVAKERIGIEKDVETHTISDEVPKERWTSKTTRASPPDRGVERDDVSTVRHEEVADVHTLWRDAGTVRARKHVDYERVAELVPRQREDVVLERR